MKIKSLFFAAALIFSSASAAQAGIYDLGLKNPGDSGTITESTSGIYNNVITGSIPTNSKITLTYTLNDISFANLSNQGYYDFNLGGNHYFGSSASTSTGLNISEGHVDALPPSPSLVLTTANLTSGSGVATVTNTSLGNATFLAVLFGYLGQGASVTVHYVVSALSNVPLPASAQLFGLAFAALAGLAYRKKLQASA